MENKFNDHDKDTMIFIVKQLESVMSLYQAYGNERNCCLSKTEGFLLYDVLQSYIYHIKERIEHPERERRDFTHNLKWDFIRELDFKPLPLEKQHTFSPGDIK